VPAHKLVVLAEPRRRAGYGSRRGLGPEGKASVQRAAGHRVLERPHRTGERGRYESVVLDPDGNRVKLTV